jgi:hypothetical protein
VAITGFVVASGAVGLDVTQLVPAELRAEVHRRVGDRSTNGKLALEVEGGEGVCSGQEV